MAVPDEEPFLKWKLGRNVLWAFGVRFTIRHNILLRSLGLSTGQWVRLLGSIINNGLVLERVKGSGKFSNAWLGSVPDFEIVVLVRSQACLSFRYWNYFCLILVIKLCLWAIIFGFELKSFSCRELGRCQWLYDIKCLKLPLTNRWKEAEHYLRGLAGISFTNIINKMFVV